MIEAKKKNYQGYPIIQVRVIAVRTNRLSVSLPDRTKGYIPRKEWTWDRSIHKKNQKFVEGSIIAAVLLPSSSIKAFSYLSIKEIDNPWENIARYTNGQIVQGEVINIRDTAIYVQVEVGIVGILRIQEIMALPEQAPMEVLSIGDKIRVKVLSIEPDERRMELSLSAPLLQKMTNSELNAMLHNSFSPALKALQENVNIFLTDTSIHSGRETFAIPPLNDFNNVLVIDNEVKDAEGVSKLIQLEYNAHTYWAKNRKEALEIIKTTQVAFDLALIDLNLEEGELGVDVARDILHQTPELPIVFISNDPLSEAYLLVLETEMKRPFPFAHKEWSLKKGEEETVNDILRAIGQLQEGKIIKRANYSATQEGRFAGNLEFVLGSNLTLQEKLIQLLQKLHEETQIEHALILHLNKERRIVSLVASHPFDHLGIYQRNLDKLYHSPVHDVIEEGEIFYSSKLREDQPHPRLKNFFPDLFFHCSYGVSIKISGQSSEYGLFVLDKRRDFFWNIISRIRLAASYSGLIIEKNSFLNNLRPVQDLLLRGELMSTFIHELNNKLIPLMDFIEEGQVFSQEGKKQELWDYFQQSANDIYKIKQLATAYSRLAKDDLEPVDLNQVVTKVHQQLAPQGKRMGIEFDVQTQSLPNIFAIAIHVEQILTNVVLNAIQQVEAHDKMKKQINEQDTNTPNFPSTKVISIKTCTSPYKNACCILVADSGPGVPFHLREKIFQLGVSNRPSGHGLGLYISKNVMEAMHGRLVWVDSIRYWGSAFALIFPLPKSSEDEYQTES